MSARGLPKTVLFEYKMTEISFPVTNASFVVMKLLICVTNLLVLNTQYNSLVSVDGGWVWISGGDRRKLPIHGGCWWL